MESSSIFLPVLGQIFLTLIAYIVLLRRKATAVKQGSVDRQKTALDNRQWPESVVKASNNIANQFETPVLFYVLCILSYLIQAVTEWLVIIAWIYVASRYVHSYVHMTSNYVPYRMKIFALGVLILLGMLVYLSYCLI